LNVITKVITFIILILILKHGDALASAPLLVISVDGATLRLEKGRKGRRVFPAGVGRVEGLGRQRSPVGLWRTGPDPSDPRFYLKARREPAFHRGLPFLRLYSPSRAELLFGIHGPVTPTLIWGQVSAGCIRLRPKHIRELYRFARRHPGMRVRIIRGFDRVGGRRVTPSMAGPRDPRCPEAGVGVRRLKSLRVSGTRVHDRVCGGVDHWYSLRLRGGDLINVALTHEGGLTVELYGIRAISTIAAGRFGFSYRVPLVQKNRGDRYLRVVASHRSRAGTAYTLEVSGR
jgi:hypothetical protein